MGKKFVECGCHGQAKPAFLCYHLINEENVAGMSPRSTTNRMMTIFFGCINAWCNKCEAKAISTRGWNDESEAFANIQLVCENCALKFKGANLN